MTWFADYSGGRPSGAALEAAGFSGVIRYIGLGSGGKRLTAAEYADLAATFGTANVLLVAELGTSDSWGSSTDDDYSRGRANAAAALADARACGVPDSVVVHAASDAHAAAQWQITDTVSYVRGFRDVLGLARTGHYGFAETQQAVHAAGVASAYWRCGSQPSAADQAWVYAWQRNTAPTVVTVSGVQVDINEVYRIPRTQEVPDMDDTQAAQLAYVYAVLKRYPDSSTGGETQSGVPAYDAAENTRRIVGKVTALGAKVDGLVAAVAALSTNPGLDAATVKQIVNDAVAQHIQITGTVNITGSAA